MLEVDVRLAGFSEIDFDSKKVRTAIRREAGGVRKTARRLVSRRAVSMPGEYAGKATGRQQRSIKVRMARTRGGKGGLWGSIGPAKTTDMEDYYPGILVAGVTGNARRKDHKVQPKTGTWRIAPRKNYMPDALKSREAIIRANMREAMIDALVARK